MEVLQSGAILIVTGCTGDAKTENFQFPPILRLKHSVAINHLLIVDRLQQQVFLSLEVKLIYYILKFWDIEEC